MPLFRSKAEDKVRQAGYDPARLPPGQYFTEKWPVLHAGEVPDVDIATWTLELTGEVEQPIDAQLRRSSASSPPPRSRPTSTASPAGAASTRSSKASTGASSRSSAGRSRARTSSIAHAEHGFTANVPLEALEDENALIVYEADGEPLTPDHGYPVRLFIPTKYFWKSAKWLRGIELSAVDKPGFWERYGYNNNADFWQEERYSF